MLTDCLWLIEKKNPCVFSGKSVRMLVLIFVPFSKIQTYIQVCKLVCSSQSSTAFELAAAYLQITKGTKEANNDL